MGSRYSSGAAACAATPVHPATLTSTSWSRMAHETSGRSGLMPRRIGSCASMRGFAMYPGGSCIPGGAAGLDVRAAVLGAAAVVLGRRRIVASPPRPVRAGASRRPAELEHFLGDLGKVANAHRRGDELGLRLAAQDLARSCPALLRPVNPTRIPRSAAATPPCSRRWRSTSLRPATATTCWSASVLLESRAAPRRCMPPRAAWRLA